LQPELLGATRRHGLIPYVLAPDPSALTAELAARRPVLVLQNVNPVHPFNINTINTTGSANLYNNGVTNNGASGTQTLTFVVPNDAPDSLHYNCGNHVSMNGPITIITDVLFASGFD
jgi:hypothetical protein